MRTFLKIYAAIALLGAAIIAFALLGAPAKAFLAPPPESAVVQMGNYCTGAHIGHGLVATAGHCVSKFTAEVTFLDGSTGKATLALYATENGFDDLAVFKLDKPKHYPAAPLDCGLAPLVKSEIYVAGYPAGYIKGVTMVWGRVAGPPQPWKTPDSILENIAGAPWEKDIVPINISLAGGFSGGPVFSVETGLMVGVAVGAFQTNRNLSSMVPASRLCELLGPQS